MTTIGEFIRQALLRSSAVGRLLTDGGDAPLGRALHKWRPALRISPGNAAAVLAQELLDANVDDVSWRRVVQLALGTVFRDQPYEGLTWLLPLQEAHYQHHDTDDDQLAWLEWKVRYAGRDLRILLRVLAGDDASSVFTGIRRFQARVRKEIRAPSGRRQRSDTMYTVLLLFAGGEAAVRQWQARVPRSDVALLATVLVPRFLTPDAGIDVDDLPPMFDDLLTVMSYWLLTAPSKNATIRRVKLTVRKEWDASLPAVHAALRALRVSFEEKAAADQSAHEQRRYNIRHPIVVERDHVLELIRRHLHSDDWAARAAVLLLNTGARLMELLMVSDFEPLTRRTRSMGDARALGVQKLAINDVQRLRPADLRLFFPRTRAFDRHYRRAKQVLAGGSVSPVRQLRRDLAAVSESESESTSDESPSDSDSDSELDDDADMDNVVHAARVGNGGDMPEQGDMVIVYAKGRPRWAVGRVTGVDRRRRTTIIHWWRRKTPRGRFFPVWERQNGRVVLADRAPAGATPSLSGTIAARVGLQGLLEHYHNVPCGATYALVSP